MVYMVYTKSTVCSPREQVIRNVMELIRQVTAKVKEDTGVTMEPEVKQIGEF